MSKRSVELIKSIVIFLLATYLPHSVFSTAQIPDKLIYNGKKYALHSNPLEEYFKEFPDKRPRREVSSTALWRGYMATFIVKDNQLYLKDIEVEVRDTTSGRSFDYKWISVLKEVFPEEEFKKIDWLSGLLVIPNGELVNYVHMGYASTYSNYILLELDKGNLTYEKIFGYKEYEKFKAQQFEAFKLTEDYQKIREELIGEGSSENEIDDFLRIYIISYTSKILEKQEE
ncbi:MAG: hypothetical protein AAF388_18320 [Bacteroidota bacterium]